MILHYGLTSLNHAAECAHEACKLFGYGVDRSAWYLLMGTAAQETHLGELPDRHADRLGVGLMQFDQIGFDDVCQRTRAKHSELLKELLGVDLSQLELRDLAYSPLLSMVMARLKYKLVPDAIPIDKAGQAYYWKKHYNSDSGAGTIEKYLHNYWRILKVQHVK